MYQLAEQKKIDSDINPLMLAVSATFTAEPIEAYIKWWCKTFNVSIV